MSIKARVVSGLTGAGMESAHRRLREGLRRLRGRPHRVTFFHRPEDPYAHLLLQALVPFRENFPGVELDFKTVSMPPEETAPRPDLLDVHALRDCRLVAPWYGLEMPGEGMPGAEAIGEASARLIGLEGDPGYLEAALEVGAALWRGEPMMSGSASSDWRSRLAENRRDLESRGHYASGMLEYGGEWYWGIDRLAFLEARLAGLGLGEGPSLRRIERPEGWSAGPRPESMEVYVSLRSPYAYLALARTFELGARHGIRLDIKPVLPMVMRGLSVPLSKRLYIVMDCARLSRALDIPFGTIADPLPGVGRALSIFPYAQSEGKGEAFLMSVGTGCWSEGVELGTDKGLRHLVERAGLDWVKAQKSMADESWRDLCESNRADLDALGLWGVPSFKLGDVVTWGQDRIWLLDEALKQAP